MASEAKKQEIRTSWKARAIGTAAGWLIRILSWTIRIEVEDHCGITEKGKIKESLIWCIWHNRMLGLAMTRKRVYPWREGVVLASASHDGAALAAALKVIGVGAVRGSSSRRGATALRGMIRQLKEGKDVGLAPDGPRGPRYSFNTGLIKLAQLAKLPVMCFHARYGCAIRIKSWDRAVIPLPFSRISIVFDELLEVPRGLDDDAFEALCRDLKERMRQGVDDLDLPAHERTRRKEDRR